MHAIKANVMLAKMNCRRRMPIPKSAPGFPSTPFKHILLFKHILTGWHSKVVVASTSTSSYWLAYLPSFLKYYLVVLSLLAI
jgi:hypothetical protein